MPGQTAFTAVVCSVASGKEHTGLRKFRENRAVLKIIIVTGLSSRFMVSETLLRNFIYSKKASQDSSDL